MRHVAIVCLGVLLGVSGLAQNYTAYTVAGGGLQGNVPGTSVGLAFLGGLAVDSAGNAYIAVAASNAVARIDAKSGTLTWVAGSSAGGYAGDNGTAVNAKLNEPLAVILDAAGNLYIADTLNNVVRKVSNGIITTIAGNGTLGYSGDGGPATHAQLHWPYGMALDAQGNLYIADNGNDVIRKVSNGIISTIAGNGTQGYSGDNGPATAAQLNQLTGVAVDAAGNVYIADAWNNVIRKVSNGTITTAVGNGTAGYAGDGGPATSAELTLLTALSSTPPGTY